MERGEKEFAPREEVERVNGGDYASESYKERARDVLLFDLEICIMDELKLGHSRNSKKLSAGKWDELDEGLLGIAISTFAGLESVDNDSLVEDLFLRVMRRIDRDIRLLGERNPELLSEEKLSEDIKRWEHQKSRLKDIYREWREALGKEKSGAVK